MARFENAWNGSGETSYNTLFGEVGCANWARLLPYIRITVGGKR
ncbi:hypothetical protein NIES4071_28690 [Calothrix sp. NIES-4071]|nr:hypothetical protein NIES4071_28690 [Calothrix sp. NIES-4071]BAZ57191.1 hypothetical protein NIES4105_28630 [Calothrix sp. NIES-4105]